MAAHFTAIPALCPRSLLFDSWRRHFTSNRGLRHCRYSPLPVLHLRQQVYQHYSLAISFLLLAGTHGLLGLF
jgi:hypothetical protein